MTGKPPLYFSDALTGSKDACRLDSVGGHDGCFTVSFINWFMRRALSYDYEGTPGGLGGA